MKLKSKEEKEDSTVDSTVVVSHDDERRHHHRPSLFTETEKVSLFQELGLGKYRDGNYKCDNCGITTKSNDNDNDNKAMTLLSPCGNCMKKFYCSKKCQKIAWKNHHKIECSFIPMLQKFNVEWILRDNFSTIVSYLKKEIIIARNNKNNSSSSSKSKKISRNHNNNDEDNYYVVENDIDIPLVIDKSTGEPIVFLYDEVLQECYEGFQNYSLPSLTQAAFGFL